MAAAADDEAGAAKGSEGVNGGLGVNGIGVAGDELRGRTEVMES